MSQRKVREFERLLVRSEALEDQELLKINAAALDAQFDELRKLSVFSKDQERAFHSRIRVIQNKIGPKVAVPKPKARTVAVTKEESGMAKERMKHGQLTDELLVLTELLKSNVSEVSVANAEDAEVLRNVQDSVDVVTNGADKNTKQFNEVKSERLGWKVYYWLFLVIIIYMVVNFLFL